MIHKIFSHSIRDNEDDLEGVDQELEWTENHCIPQGKLFYAIDLNAIFVDICIAATV